MLRHAACGARGSVSVIEPHSQTPGVLTGNRLWGALSKRFVKCVRKAPHPFGLEPNPALNRSLDENLVYKFWEFPGHVHFSKACVAPHCDLGPRLCAGHAQWGGESLMHRWRLLLVALARAARLPKRGSQQLLGMLMLPAVHVSPLWPQASPFMMERKWMLATVQSWPSSDLPLPPLWWTSCCFSSYVGEQNKESRSLSPYCPYFLECPLYPFLPLIPPKVKPTATTLGRAVGGWMPASSAWSGCM